MLFNRGFIVSVIAHLFNWGVKETKTDKKKRSLKLIAELMERYQPKVFVVEDYGGKGSRRCQRVGELINDISKVALKRGIRVKSVSRLKVKQVFFESGASNKHEIAVAIANQFPELAPRLPRFRKPWMSEDYRMSIFDAVGFGLAFVHSKTKG